jgi:hypothetical protein
MELRPQRVDDHKLWILGRREHLVLADEPAGSRFGGEHSLWIPLGRTALDRTILSQPSTEAGLLRETVVEPGRSYFDTNTADHHHFFCEATGKLHDIPAQQLSVSGLPLPPAGTEIRRVDIIVRIGPGGVP